MRWNARCTQVYSIIVIIVITILLTCRPFRVYVKPNTIEFAHSRARTHTHWHARKHKRMAVLWRAVVSLARILYFYCHIRSNGILLRGTQLTTNKYHDDHVFEHTGAFLHSCTPTSASISSKSTAVLCAFSFQSSVKLNARWFRLFISTTINSEQYFFLFFFVSFLFIWIFHLIFSFKSIFFHFECRCRFVCAYKKRIDSSARKFLIRRRIRVVFIPK